MGSFHHGIFYSQADKFSECKTIGNDEGMICNSYWTSFSISNKPVREETFFVEAEMVIHIKLPKKELLSERMALSGCYRSRPSEHPGSY